MTNAPIDDQVIRNAFGDDDETVTEILQSFLAPGLKTVKRLRDGLDQHALQEIRIAAHNLGSGALQIGAMEFGKLAREVEAAANRGDWGFIEATVPTLESLMVAVSTYIESL